MDAEPAPLAGRRIVVTRSAADNRSLVATLAALGASTVEVPLVEVQAPGDGGLALGRAVAGLSDYRWVVLTSVNGVRAVRAAMGADARWPQGVTVAPVGPATAVAARSAGMIVAPPPPIHTARALVDGFAPWDGVGGRRVLAPLAELAGPTVVDGLADKGYVVDRVDAYRTAAPEGSKGWQGSDGSCAAEAAIAEPGLTDLVGGADAVAFFSPSVVDRFVERFERHVVPGAVICIGPSTASRAAAHGLEPVVTADPHTESGIVAAICRILQVR